MFLGLGKMGEMGGVFGDQRILLGKKLGEGEGIPTPPGPAGLVLRAFEFGRWSNG